MKTTLGMICKNEEHYLSLILPMIRGCFNEFVAIDAESTDRTVPILKEYGAKVVNRPWTNNYSDARNEVIRHSTGDWMFMLDADEAMFPDHIEKIKNKMPGSEAIALRRVEFVGDHQHFDPKVAPDWQCRVFKMGIGFSFRSPVHEMLVLGNESVPVLSTSRALRLSDCPIYHYGQCKPREQVWLRHHNYSLVKAGLPTLKEVPHGFQVEKRLDVELFPGNHPLE